MDSPPFKKPRPDTPSGDPSQATRRMMGRLNRGLKARRPRRRHVLNDPRTTSKMRVLAGHDLQFGAAFPAFLLDMPDRLYVQQETRCTKFFEGYRRQPKTCTTLRLADRDPLGSPWDEEEEERRCAGCVEDADCHCSECGGSLAHASTAEDASSRQDGESPCPTYFTRVALSCVRDVRHLVLAPYHSLCRYPDVWCATCLEDVIDQGGDGLRRANRETVKQLCLLNRVDFPPVEILHDADASPLERPGGDTLRDNAYWDETSLSARYNLWNPIVDKDAYDLERVTRAKVQDEKDRARRRGQPLGVCEWLGPVTAARRLFFRPALVGEAAVPLGQQRIRGVFREGYIYDFGMDD